jgi:hypothetical protein
MLRKLLAVSQSIQVLPKLQVSLSMAGLFIFSKQKTAAAFGEQRRLS